jgi:DNA-binding response OmpR family regulator
MAGIAAEQPQPVGTVPGARVLVVDDDVAVRRVVGRALEREGFAVAEASDGSQALDHLRAGVVDLVVLDINLPNVGGFEVLTEIRQSMRVPVICLTGRDEEIDRILGLELGADDYVVKPFSPRELASRVRAVLRRTQTEPQRNLEFGDLHIDQHAREVRVRGSAVDFTAREFDLLAFLAGAPRRVFSRGELLEAVWNSAAEWQDPATVTEHVRRIRIKLGDDRERPRWIRTVRSAGYAFEP